MLNNTKASQYEIHQPLEGGRAVTKTKWHYTNWNSTRSAAWARSLAWDFQRERRTDHPPWQATNRSPATMEAEKPEAAVKEAAKDLDV